MNVSHQRQFLTHSSSFLCRHLKSQNFYFHISELIVSTRKKNDDNKSMACVEDAAKWKNEKSKKRISLKLKKWKKYAFSWLETGKENYCWCFSNTHRCTWCVTFKHTSSSYLYELINTDIQMHTNLTLTHASNWIELHVSCTNLWRYSISSATQWPYRSRTDIIEPMKHCKILSFVFFFLISDFSHQRDCCQYDCRCQQSSKFICLTYDFKRHTLIMELNFTSSENYYFIFLFIVFFYGFSWRLLSFRL